MSIKLTAEAVASLMDGRRPEWFQQLAVGEAEVLFNRITFEITPQGNLIVRQFYGNTCLTRNDVGDFMKGDSFEFNGFVGTMQIWANAG